MKFDGQHTYLSLLTSYITSPVTYVMYHLLLCRADEAHPNDMTDRDVDKLIVVTSAKKSAKPALDQQLIDDGLALYQEQLSEVRYYCMIQPVFVVVGAVSLELLIGTLPGAAQPSELLLCLSLCCHVGTMCAVGVLTGTTCRQCPLYIQLYLVQQFWSCCRL
jgi:hypothetical protein